jgi:hypothetical protein
VERHAALLEADEERAIRGDRRAAALAADAVGDVRDLEFRRDLFFTAENAKTAENSSLPQRPQRPQRLTIPCEKALVSVVSVVSVVKTSRFSAVFAFSAVKKSERRAVKKPPTALGVPTGR